MAQGKPGRPPGSNKPKRYKYAIVHAQAPNTFETQLNNMATQGWRVIGQSFSSVQFFSALMEKEDAAQIPADRA